MNTCRFARRPKIRTPFPTRVPIVRIGIVLASLSMLGTPAGFAQDVPQQLTLERAIEIAEQLSPQHHIASNQLEAAEQGVRQARADAFIPRFRASLGSSLFATRSLETEDFFSQPLDEPFREEFWSASTSQAFGFELPVFDMSNIRRLRGSNASRRNAEAGFEMEAFNLRAEVSRRYYAVLQAEDAVELERQLVRSAEENLDRQRRLFQIVSAQREDILGAELELMSRENSLEDAIGESRKARLALLEVLGIPGERAFELTDGLPETFDPALLSVVDLASHAIANSPRIRQAHTDVAQSEAELGVAGAYRWPTLSLRGSVYRRHTTRDDHAAFFDVNPPNSGYDFGLSLQIPVSLFQFHSRPQREIAGINYDNAQEDLRQERIEIERQVREALIDLEQAHRNIGLADRTVEIATERVRLTEERMRASGTGSFFELDQLRESLANSERGALEARFIFQNSLFTLEEMAGRRVQP